MTPTWAAVGMYWSAGLGASPGVAVALAYDDEQVTEDFSHPLSGLTILFGVLVRRGKPIRAH